MTYTVGTAAKATGKSKPTITRAIQSGKISAERRDDGSYSIDAAELHRVFPPLPSASNDTAPMTRAETPIETGGLQVEVKMLRELLDAKDDTISDLRRRLDAEAEERRRLTLLLTDQRPPAGDLAGRERPRRNWWPFGRSND